MLPAGERRTDVAVYNQSIGYIADPFDAGALQAAGYSYGYVSPGSLASERARVASGRLSPDGPAFRALNVVNPATLVERSTNVRNGRLVVQKPGYRALVVDLDASSRGVIDNTQAMEGSVALRLAAMARAGLPIVFVGRFPERGVGYRDADGEDAQVRQSHRQAQQLAARAVS